MNEYKIGPAPASRQIEALEDEYAAFGKQADIEPGHWGQEQEDQLSQIAEALRAEYDFHGVDEWDRVV